MQKIEISYRTIVFAVIFILSLWFIWVIKNIILQLLVAVILMTAFNPLVNKLERIKRGKLKMSRSIAIMLIFLLILGVISFIVSSLAQPLVLQTSNFINQLPVILEHLAGWGIDQSVIERQVGQLNTLPGDLIKLAGGVFSNILGVFTTLVMAFYLLLEREKLHTHLTDFLGNEKLERQVEKFIDKLEENLGGWVRAELILMLIVGLMTYTGLVLLRIPFALPLAIIAGLLEIVPNIGPVLSAVPALVVAISLSPVTGLGVVALYLLVQLVENNLVVPQVMSKTVGVSPLVTIIALLVGFNLAGVSGAVLAMPIVLIIRVLAQFIGATKWSKN